MELADYYIVFFVKGLIETLKNYYKVRTSKNKIVKATSIL